MFATTTRILLVVVAFLCATAGARAQTTPGAVPAATPKDHSTVSRLTFRSKVFELKYRDPESLMNALQPLGSSDPHSIWTFSRDLKTIAVRDFPENLAVIEEAVGRLDKPEAAQPGIEFHIHILIATNDAAPTKPYPAELESVIKQLQTTLSYKNYSLMSSDVLRGKVGGGPISNKGVAELKLSPDMAASNNPIFYEYRLAVISVDTANDGATKVQAGNFSFNMKVPVAVSTGNLQYESIGFSTPVSMREGEKVVVGTTSMQDKGLVIVITASIVK